MNSGEMTDTEAIARSVFADIAERFPPLRMVENSGEPVEISITIPVQPGVSYKVWLCLQNHDELHFSAGHLWVEWPVAHDCYLGHNLDPVVTEKDVERVAQ